MTERLSSVTGTGGRGAIRARRLVRRLPMVVVGLVTLASTTACATKRDIRDLRMDMRSEAESVQVRQDSIFRLLRMQNREIMDSLAVTTRQLMDVRGELATQLRTLMTEMEQVGNLTAQVQVRLNRLDQQLDAVTRRLENASAGLTGGDPGGQADAGPGTFDEAEQYYAAGREQIGNQNAQTARRAFQMIVEQFPDHRRAPEALFQIGETYYMEGNFEEAFSAFDAVVSRYQNSPSAPQALYRAGVIAEERGNNDRARQYFNRVISGYPRSDARQLAERALERLGG